MKKGAVVLMNTDDDDRIPCFGIIEELFVDYRSDIHAGLRIMDTIEYRHHFHSWTACVGETKVLFRLENPTLLWPRRASSRGPYFLTLKHSLPV